MDLPTAKALEILAARISALERRAPYKAPKPTPGEMHDHYLERLALSFQEWVNEQR